MNELPKVIANPIMQGYTCIYNPLEDVYLLRQDATGKILKVRPSIDKDYNLTYLVEECCDTN